MRTGNISLVKKMNKQLVLKLIRDQHPISRADIAKTTGLNKATVSALVDELIAEHFVHESGIGESTGGRRPLMLRFNADAGSLIGVELGVNYLYAVLTNLNADILWEQRRSFRPSEGQEAIIGEMMELIEAAIRRAPATPYGVMGIGIGVPGVVHTESGTVVFAPNLRWDDVALAAVLRQRWPERPVIVENEAKLAALGEKWFGAGNEFAHFVYISAGIGIGAGVVLHHQLYRGVSGLAGEIGHHTIDVNGIRCSCGNIGCWEMYASEKYIERRLAEEGRSEWLDERFSIAAMALAAESDEQLARILEETGRYLGVGLLQVIYAYNPEAVIIGGPIAQAGEYVIGPARQEVRKRILVKKESEPSIISSKLKEKSCAIGAAASVLEAVVLPPEFAAV
ncbi:MULTISPECIES: ROK family transcriptional regulator [Geobacillus]|uniref:Glucokinase n=6 Tax=Geobacillus TaxID=129337 RepID=A0A7U9P6I4_GEOTM|nr:MULTISPECIES: ROK family protein [Geobacillus]MCG6796326.1 ROK family protein [Geobacillus sp. YHL]AEV20038.1 ROK protein [Geobacillus thermoleovorans CCB_US3_UF5]AGE23010.1 xylose repressor [Geobacillus sp. GHH01]AOL35155.1 glucokinase [Geobacillus thermoleovorans]AUI37879.1 ROK family transcriptional regulator [[Bacillus] caldolyticus]